MHKLKESGDFGNPTVQETVLDGTFLGDKNIV